MSRSFIFNVCYLCLVAFTWFRVFRKTEYRAPVSTTLKCVHFCILCFVVNDAFYSFADWFLWLLFHPAQLLACLTGRPNHIGTPLTGIIGVIRALSGTILMSPICPQMANGREWALSWYFVAWPICAIASCTEVLRTGLHPISLSVGLFVATVFSCVLAGTIAFYLAPSSRVLFTPGKAA